MTKSIVLGGPVSPPEKIETSSNTPTITVGEISAESVTSYTGPLPLGGGDYIVPIGAAKVAPNNEVVDAVKIIPAPVIEPVMVDNPGPGWFYPAADATTNIMKWLAIGLFFLAVTSISMQLLGYRHPFQYARAAYDLRSIKTNIPDNQESDTLVTSRASSAPMVKVLDHGKFHLTIKFEDGRIEKRTGGTLSWRLENPGRLAYGRFAKENGAITVAGRYAVFDSYEVGKAANRKMLFSDPRMGYINLSVRDAIRKYTEGSKEADSYTGYVVTVIKVPASTLMKDLTPDQQEAFLKEIETIEPYIKGYVWKYKSVDEYKKLGSVGAF